MRNVFHADRATRPHGLGDDAAVSERSLARRQRGPPLITLPTPSRRVCGSWPLTLSPRYCSSRLPLERARETSAPAGASPSRSDLSLRCSETLRALEAPSTVIQMMYSRDLLSAAKLNIRWTYHSRHPLCSCVCGTIAETISGLHLRLPREVGRHRAVSRSVQSSSITNASLKLSECRPR